MSPETNEKKDDSFKPWKIVDAPPVFVLNQSIKQLRDYYSTTTTHDPIDAEVKLDGLFSLLSTKNGRDVVDFYLENGATYALEMEKVLGMDISTVKSRIKVLERIGDIRKTAKLANTTGGRIPYITSLVVAGPEYTKKAQARFDHSKGVTSYKENLDQFMDENADIAKQFDDHKAVEEADARRQEIIDIVTTVFLEQYGADSLPIDLLAIELLIKEKGITNSDDKADCTQNVAANLELEGVPTGVFYNGELSAGYQPSRKILEIRKRRETNS